MINRTDALELLKKYNKEDFHIHHGLTLEAVMKYEAKKQGFEEDAEFWGKKISNGEKTTPREFGFILL